MADCQSADWLRTILRLESQRNISFALYWIISTAILLVGALKQKEKEGFVLKSFAGLTLVSLVFLPVFRHLGLSDWSWAFNETASWIAFPLNAIIGAILLALGIAITMSAGGSTCGPDLFAVLAAEKARDVLKAKEDRKKAEKIESFVMVSTMRIFDGAVLALGVFAFSPENTILYIVSVGLAIIMLSKLVVAIDKVSRKVLSEQEGDNSGLNESTGQSTNKPDIQVMLLPAISGRADYGSNSILEMVLVESVQESNAEYSPEFFVLWVRANNGVLSQVSTYNNEQIVFRYQNNIV